MNDLKLHGENLFAPVHMTEKDHLRVTYRHWNRDTENPAWSEHHVDVPPEEGIGPRVFNCLRVYTADEFDGVLAPIICVLGYKVAD